MWARKLYILPYHYGFLGFFYWKGLFAIVHYSAFLKSCLKTYAYLFITFSFLYSLLLGYFFLLDCISYFLKHICLSVTKNIFLALLDIKWDILFMFMYFNSAMAAHNPLTCEDFQQWFNAMWDAFSSFWNWPSHVCMWLESSFFQRFLSLIPTYLILFKHKPVYLQNSKCKVSSRTVRYIYMNYLLVTFNFYTHCEQCVCDISATIKVWRELFGLLNFWVWVVA